LIIKTITPKPLDFSVVTNNRTRAHLSRVTSGYVTPA